MLLIRADGNKKIGTGHLMRCLSIAEQAKKKDEIVFVVADEYGEEIVEKRGFASLVLHTDYKNMEMEISLLSQLICQLQVEMILVDSYYITKEYIEELSELTSVSLMEDMLTDAYPVKNVINYNIYATEENYRKIFQEQSVNLPSNFLLGPLYAPLRKQFMDINYQIKKEVTSVLLTTGGTDPFNIAGIILKELLENKVYRSYTFHVVSGIFNVNLPKLKEIAKINRNVILYKDISDMAAIMKSCDVAISAAGTTMYELAAVGIPTITYAFVDNQDQIAEKFASENMAAYAGSSTMDLKERCAKIMQQFEKLVNHLEIRKEMHQALRSQVDGMGAKRIYDIISTK